MGPLDPWHLVATALAMAVLALVAYRFAFLDAGGGSLAFAMGVLILLSGGFAWLLLLFFFAGLGFLATRVGARRKRRLLAQAAGRGEDRRGWRNVAGNGATASVVAAFAFVIDAGHLALPFAVAVTVAAADTLASEIGALSPRAVLITRPGMRVPPGTDGGVSLLGTAASAVAACIVAAVAYLLLPLTPGFALIAAAAGLAGSLLDSLLGALWEASPRVPGRPLSKTQVNLIAITVPTLLVLPLPFLL